MPQSEIIQEQPVASLLCKVYKVFKYSCIFILTMAVMVPLIYLIGTEFTTFHKKPFYNLYQTDPNYQHKLAAIEEVLQSTKKGVNLYAYDNATEPDDAYYSQEWDNLLDFGHYLAYKQGLKGVRTIYRHIIINKADDSPKGKSKRNKQVMAREKEERKVRQAEQYEVLTFSESHVLKRKINDAAVKLINKSKFDLTPPLKEMRVGKINNLGTLWKYLKQQIARIAREHVVARRLWLIVANTRGNATVDSAAIVEQVKEISKIKGRRDWVVVLTKKPLKMSKKPLLEHIHFEIDHEELHQLREKLFETIKQKLLLPHSRHSEQIFCRNDGSLYYLNQFLSDCEQHHQDCTTWIQKLRTSNLKQQTNIKNLHKLVQDVCKKEKARLGEDQHVEQVAYDYGLIATQINQKRYLVWANQTIRLMYEIANNDVCTKQGHNCNASWIYEQAPKIVEPVIEITNNLTQKQANPQGQKIQVNPQGQQAQAILQGQKAEDLPLQQVNPQEKGQDGLNSEIDTQDIALKVDDSTVVDAVEQEIKIQQQNKLKEEEEAKQQDKQLQNKQQQSKQQSNQQTQQQTKDEQATQSQEQRKDITNNEVNEDHDPSDIPQQNNQQQQVPQQPEEKQPEKQQQQHPQQQKNEAQVEAEGQ